MTLSESRNLGCRFGLQDEIAFRNQAYYTFCIFRVNPADWRDHMVLNRHIRALKDVELDRRLTDEVMTHACP